MKLSKCLDCLEDNLLSISSDDDPILDHVSCDSREIVKGGIFVAIKGANFNGEDFLEQVLSQGCNAVVTTSEIDCNVPVVIVKDSYKALAQLSEMFHDYPTASMHLVGVTGTNGKSSVSMMINWLLKQSGTLSGLVGTIEISYGDICQPAVMTTPAVCELQKIFVKMNECDTEVAVLEVSSHALEQSRLGTSLFNTAVFTNLTQEHLDYHGDMQSYFKAKQKLFTERLAKDGLAIVNIDDSYGAELADLLPPKNCLTVGETSEADWRLTNIQYLADHTEFNLSSNDRDYKVISPLIGHYNAMNLAQALLAVSNEGLTIEQALELIKDFPGIPGRLELFKGTRDRKVIIDYAHTPDALQKTLECLGQMPGQLHCLFGCGGDRDCQKRPVMGSIAEKLADKVYLCDDNPRTEDPALIIEDILKGIKNTGAVHVENDRRACIELAIAEMADNALLLIAGKGHENYQIVGTEKQFFCDRALIKEIFESERAC